MRFQYNSFTLLIVGQLFILLIAVLQENAHALLIMIASLVTSIAIESHQRLTECNIFFIKIIVQYTMPVAMLRQERQLEIFKQDVTSASLSSVVIIITPASQDAKIQPSANIFNIHHEPFYQKGVISPLLPASYRLLSRPFNIFSEELC